MGTPGGDGEDGGGVVGRGVLGMGRGRAWRGGGEKGCGSSDECMGGRVGGSTVLPARWDRWLTIVWPLFDHYLTSGTTVLAARWDRWLTMG